MRNGTFGTSVDTSFILGMGKAAGQVTILLDISRVLTNDELATVASTAQSTTKEE